jgi:hypothetical protein
MGVKDVPREEHRLMMSENRVVRRIFGPKREEEVVGGWRILHKEELCNLYTSPNTVRVRWVRHVAHMGQMRNTQF